MHEVIRSSMRGATHGPVLSPCSPKHQCSLVARWEEGEAAGIGLEFFFLSLCLSPAPGPPPDAHTCGSGKVRLELEKAKYIRAKVGNKRKNQHKK